MGEQALATQPLPFRCPMDHVLNVGSWHGKGENRKARGERCAVRVRVRVRVTLTRRAASAVR